MQQRYYTTNIIYSCAQSTLNFQMTEANYTPNVNFSCGHVVSIQFKLENVIATIHEDRDITAPDDSLMTIDEKDLEIYEKADQEFYQWLVNQEHVSQSNEQTIKIESAYPQTAICGYFDKYDSQSYNAIDINKKYPACLMEIEHFPVFSIFDIYVDNDDHPIEDCTYYLIKSTCALCKSVYSLCFGYVLKRMTI